MSLWQRLQTLLCPAVTAVKRPIPTWFWGGRNKFDFAAGDGNWPLQILEAGRLDDMQWANGAFTELDGKERLYGRLWDGCDVYEIYLKKKQAFVWGFPAATYGADGHPHPNAGAFWVEMDAVTKLWRAIKAHRRGQARP